MAGSWSGGRIIAGNNAVINQSSGIQNTFTADASTGSVPNWDDSVSFDFHGILTSIEVKLITASSVNVSILTANGSAIPLDIAGDLSLTFTTSKVVNNLNVQIPQGCKIAITTAGAGDAGKQAAVGLWAI